MRETHRRAPKKKKDARETLIEETEQLKWNSALKNSKVCHKTEAGDRHKVRSHRQSVSTRDLICKQTHEPEQEKAKRVGNTC